MYKKRYNIVRAIRTFSSKIALSGKLGQTATDFQVKWGKSASLMESDESLPGNNASSLVSFA